MRKFLLLALLLVQTTAFANPSQTAPITGIYSNLSYDQESGDLGGMELLILPDHHGPDLTYIVLVQISEGGAPVSFLVPLKIVGNKIEFTLPKEEGFNGEHFTGEFKGKDLLVHWPSGNEEYLKRGKSHWQ